MTLRKHMEETEEELTQLRGASCHQQVFLYKTLADDGQSPSNDMGYHRQARSHLSTLFP